MLGFLRIDMDEKTLIALTALANKLGTTAEYLWGVLLKQAPIYGVIEILIMAAWIIATVLWFCFVVKKTKRPNATKDDKYPEAEWHSEAAFCAWLSVFLLMFFSGVLVSNGISKAISGLLNPEYWALRQILK
jgi:NADH:ubiquinone oxidoreductase subunit 6 (subunit J)